MFVNKSNRNTVLSINKQKNLSNLKKKIRLIIIPLEHIEHSPERGKTKLEPYKNVVQNVINGFKYVF